jgi:hypothetical protein
MVKFNTLKVDDIFTGMEYDRRTYFFVIKIIDETVFLVEICVNHNPDFTDTGLHFISQNKEDWDDDMYDGDNISGNVIRRISTKTLIKYKHTRKIIKGLFN